MVSLEPKHYHFSVESLLLDLVFVSKLCWQGISLLLNRASCQPAIVVSVSVMTLRALPHMILSPRPLRAPQAVNLKSFISFHRIRFLCCRKYPSKPKFGCEIESELHQQPRFGRLTHSLGEPFVLLTEVTEHCLNFCFFGFSSAPNVIDKVIKMWFGEKLINVSATLFYQSKSFQFLHTTKYRFAVGCQISQCALFLLLLLQINLQWWRGPFFRCVLANQPLCQGWRIF